jgi:hypothetical protein
MPVPATGQTCTPAHMTQTTKRRGLIALALIALAACSGDGTQNAAPFAPTGRVFRPVYVVNGTTKRLNLTTEDQAKVAFKDPIQGVKDAPGNAASISTQTPCTRSAQLSLASGTSRPARGSCAPSDRGLRADHLKGKKQEHVTRTDYPAPGAP